jgi:hypothetical protein
MSRHGHIVVALALLAGAAPAQEAPRQELAKNPFSRPEFMTELRDAPAAIFLARPVELRLLATLISDGESLANINGEVLARGETYEGHRVLHIAEDRVVLAKNGERVTLDLYATTDSDTD